MHNLFFSSGCCSCTLCGQELGPGEEYWYINGTAFCGDCLETYAREDYRGFRHTAGKEMDES